MTHKEFNESPQGFYYDRQLESKLLSVTLHPNTVISNGKWDKVTDAEEGEDCPKKKDGNPCDFPYSKTPICRSVISEDFQVSISNTFSDFGNDAIGTFWNSPDVKAIAPYVDEIGGSLTTILQKTSEWLEGKAPKDSEISKMAKKISDNAPKLIKKGSDYLSRALVVQGTRFAYYGGTGLDFGNLSMKFTLFSDWNKEGTEFISVNEKVKDILPYVVGDFVELVDGTEVEEGVKEFVNRFASWQIPPGGFKSDLKSVDTVQQGTLKLRIGVRYAIENLVISSAQINFSKTMVKNPKGGEDETYLVPHSCDVVLNLRPASLYSRDSLERFVSGAAVRDSLNFAAGSRRIFYRRDSFRFEYDFSSVTYRTSLTVLLLL
jgi:hypothetical protein